MANANEATATAVHSRRREGMLQLQRQVGTTDYRRRLCRLQMFGSAPPPLDPAMRCATIWPCLFYPASEVLSDASHSPFPFPPRCPRSRLALHVRQRLRSGQRQEGPQERREEGRK